MVCHMKENNINLSLHALVHNSGSFISGVVVNPEMHATARSQPVRNAPPNTLPRPAACSHNQVSADNKFKRISHPEDYYLDIVSDDDYEYNGGRNKQGTVEEEIYEDVSGANPTATTAIDQEISKITDSKLQTSLTHKNDNYIENNAATMNRVQNYKNLDAHVENAVDIKGTASVLHKQKPKVPKKPNLQKCLKLKQQKAFSPTAATTTSTNLKADSLKDP